MKKILVAYLTVVGFISFGLTIAGAVKAETVNHDVQATTAVQSVVQAMNQAITQRNMEALLATFASGAVKLDLYRAHAYDKVTKPGQVADLAERWKTVTAILFASTRVYERKVENMQVHLDKGMAVVWATIATRTEYFKSRAEPKTNRYSEIYVLRLIEDTWKIVAVTNNRQEMPSTRSSQAKKN